LVTQALTKKSNGTPRVIRVKLNTFYFLRHPGTALCYAQCKYLDIKCYTPNIAVAS